MDTGVYAAKDLVTFGGTAFVAVRDNGPAGNRPPLVRPVLGTPASSGRTLTVGPGGYATLGAAVDASAAGDRIEVQPGFYTGDETAIRHDLSIVGIGRPTITWNGGVGPYLQVFGTGTKAHIEGLNLVGNGVNTSLIGDRQAVYGYPPTGADQVIRLVDLNLWNTGGAAIFAWSPGVNYEILGGEYAPILLGGQAGTLVVASSASGPARLGFVIPGSDRVCMEYAVISQSVHLNETSYESIGFSAVQFTGPAPYFLTGYPGVGTDYSALVAGGPACLRASCSTNLY